MMKDASMQKQIIITTHNPEIVKYSGLENIFLLRRNKNGFSEVARPQDSVEVKNFLENKLGDFADYLNKAISYALTKSFKDNDREDITKMFYYNNKHHLITHEQ